MCLRQPASTSGTTLPKKHWKIIRTFFCLLEDVFPVLKPTEYSLRAQKMSHGGKLAAFSRVSKFAVCNLMPIGLPMSYYFPPHFIKSVWIKWYSAQNSAKALVMANWTRWALLFPECQFICSLLLTWHSDLFKMNLCNLYSFSEVLQGMNLDGCCHLLYPTRKQKTSPRTRKFGVSWDLSVGALLHLHIF